MNLHEGFRRRVRIEGGINDLKGNRLTITDLETGEEIQNVIKAVIILDAREYNGVELTYLEVDEQDKIIVIDADVVEKKLRLNFPEISLTALESETKP
jgi:hypothetical protein